jgi:hypothetical protein
MLPERTFSVDLCNEKGLRFQEPITFAEILKLHDLLKNIGNNGF